ncbi:hypothetical protein EVAR_41065_1 [Eumeta japonica]|uniref:N-acetyltransferase domain-containing protein n=1 Tax=Eumeta variegata TaxID=151549 RepID=A0A4C1XSY2_EUMVA|nr:hypothetical protein EVAR_41065_1 [Eumeta japonica]
MPYTRVWDEECPRVWDQWEEDGAHWTVQDLDPDDDELAVELFIRHFLTDELLLNSLGAHKEEASVVDARAFWRKNVSGRTSLACYRSEGDNKTLVALNACPVNCVDDPPYDLEAMVSKRWRQVVSVLVHAESLCDVFKELNVDKVLNGAGLLVVPQWRGKGLGKKLLHAREPMCRALNIRATSTVFTGPASQREAQHCGFETLLTLTREQLDRAGLRFPISPDYVLKLMAKKYD